MSSRSILSRLIPGFIRRSFRAKLFVAFLVLGAAATVQFAHFTGQLFWRQQLVQAQSLMYATVVLMAEALDGEAIKALGDVEDVRTDPRFETARTKMVSMRDAVVNAIDQETGETIADETVVDLYVLGRTEDPGVGRLTVTYREEEAGQLYDMSRFPTMMKAWEMPAVEDKPVTDEYGTALSAYAPIRDSSGNVVAIAGVDSAAAYFNMMILATVINSTAAFILGALISLLFAWALSRVMLRSFARLSVGMEQVGQGNLACQVEGLATGDDFDRLIARFNEMVRGLRDREAIKQDLAQAATIQTSLLPHAAPQVPGFEFAGGIKYCQETGGDYFDYIALPAEGQQRWGVVVGDVTGHGVASALLMCSSRAVLRGTARTVGDDVSSLMQAVNAHLVHESPDNAFMTTFYGVLDVAERRLTWSNAGHEPAILLRRATGMVEHLGAGDLPLGIELDRQFDAGTTVRFEEGDVLVIGTDGISQARNQKGDFFGFDGMEDVLRDHQDASATEIKDAILQAAQLHEGRTVLEDDATLVVIKCGAPS